LFDHVLTVCAVCQGFALVRTLRRIDGRAYAFCLVALLGLTLAALLQPSRFVGVVAIALSFVALVVPLVLESVARWCFSRGKLGVAVSLCGVRAMLMPGAGLGRQQEILRGLALLESHGVDRALAHFRGLASDAEGGESLVIHEQIVSMMFYGQRWEDGIAHYEAQFHPRYAALRPALALGLLRAYGESGRLDHAAVLLRALEEGPIGMDPGAIGVVSQARLTFLAYAGVVSSVQDALTEPRRRTLGLSAASSALLRGIALGRAGQQDAARRELMRVADVANAQDVRIVEASRATMAQGPAGAIDLAPDLSQYADKVARRLEAFLQAAPRLRRGPAVWLAPTIATVILVVELCRNGFGRGGVGLLDLGAVTTELWHAGSWGRTMVSSLLAGQPLAAVVDAYAVWVGGRVIERVLGRGRLLAVAFGGAGLAMFASVLVPGMQGAAAGAPLLAVSVATGALMLLPRLRGPALTLGSRRALLIGLVVVLAIQIGGALAGVFALEVPLVGIWVAALWGVLVVGIVPTSGALATMVAWVGFATILPLVLGTLQLAREDAETFLVSRRTLHESAGVSLQLPSTIVATPARRELHLPLPIPAGFVDALALRAGDLLSLQIGTAADGEALPFALDPSLRRELDAVPADVPAAFARRFTARGGQPESLRAFHLRRNGEDVALVVQRSLGDGRQVAWVAAPPAALGRTPGLHAAVLADAVASGGVVHGAGELEVEGRDAPGVVRPQ
jgi:hypothetical protein